jgi:hypothetical protein
MQYFRALPKTLYTFNAQDESPRAAVNIFARFRTKPEVLNNAYAYYKYQLKDGDTPEIVAHQQYDDASLHWIVCFVNDLKDPQFEFPLSQTELDNKIIKQYGYTSIANAYSDIHHYELQVVRTLAEVDGMTATTTETNIVTLEQYSYKSNTIVLQPLNTPVTETVSFRANNSDPNTAITSTLSVTSTYKPVYVYDYENELNEAKRSIKLLKPQFVQAMAAELQTVVNE